MQNVLEILKSRGLLEDVTSPELGAYLAQPRTVYAGFDPTSNSLQIGNYVAIVTLQHFQRCGHRVIAVVGGATGMIGDPSGKSAERKLLTEEDVQRNLLGIRENLSRFLDFNHPTAPATIVNNNDWMREMTFVAFLREVGKHFRMGAMLGKESVRARLASESGMSFAEFSYQLLQAYDFLRLYDTHGCTVQVGGSDQWGNITAGIDLVRKLRGAELYGATMPLICDAAGQKFGKSEGNAVYLDAAKTSPYELYQFFLRVEDADVIRLLKVFTHVPLDECAELDRQLLEAPDKRAAQKRLAAEVTRAVHGEAGLAAATRASEVLFGGSMDGLSADDLLQIFRDVESAELARVDVADQPLIDVVVRAGLCKSKGEARRLVDSGGLYANARRVAGVGEAVAAGDLVGDRLLVLRSGKKKFLLVKVV